LTSDVHAHVSHKNMFWKWKHRGFSLFFFLRIFYSYQHASFSIIVIFRFCLSDFDVFMIKLFFHLRALLQVKSAFQTPRNYVHFLVITCIFKKIENILILPFPSVKKSIFTSPKLKSESALISPTHSDM
jgi:hypothetical protein